MKALIYIFLGMFLYGCFAAQLGAAMASYMWAVFVFRCSKRMDREQAAYEASPDRAKEPPDTLVVLERAECECCYADLRV